MKNTGLAKLVTNGNKTCDKSKSYNRLAGMYVKELLPTTGAYHTIFALSSRQAQRKSGTLVPDFLLLLRLSVKTAICNYQFFFLFRCAQTIIFMNYLHNSKNFRNFASEKDIYITNQLFR